MDILLTENSFFYSTQQKSFPDGRTILFPKDRSREEMELSIQKQGYQLSEYGWWPAYGMRPSPCWALTIYKGSVCLLLRSEVLGPTWRWAQEFTSNIRTGNSAQFGASNQVMDFI